MKEISIKKNDAGQRLDKFITKSFNIPQSLMYRYIRTKHIKVNGRRSEISYRLQEGDTVTMYIKDELLGEKEQKYDFLRSSKVLNIVYEDENILLADKPQGLIVHPDENEYSDTLITRIQHYLYDKGEYNPRDEHSFAPALVNRIDRNTGGIVIAAKNAEALRILNRKLKDREIDKYYYCLVHGKMPRHSDCLEGYLEKNEDKNKVYISNKASDNNKRIKTKYTVIAECGDMSLLEIELLTGRTHQIRAHMASIGHPLVGDGKYGRLQQDKRLGYKHQALYSYRLIFNFSTDAGILNYLNGREFSVKSVWFAEQFTNQY